MAIKVGGRGPAHLARVQSAIPANAIYDRAASPIQDRAATYILTR